jgi:hypothetical protein
MSDCPYTVLSVAWSSALAALLTALFLHEVWRTRHSQLTALVLRLRTERDYERHLADSDTFPNNPLRCARPPIPYILHDICAARPR